MARTRISGTGGEGGRALPWILGLGVLGYLGYKYVVKPKVLLPIQTKNYVDRIQITDAGFSLDLKHTRGELSFVINNPNPKPMLIQAIVGHVTIYQADPKKPGIRLGDVDHFQPIEIKPFTGLRVRLSILLKAVNSIAYLASVLTGGWKGQILNFQGTVTANGHPWPINQTLKLSK